MVDETGETFLDLAFYHLPFRHTHTHTYLHTYKYTYTHSYMYIERERDRQTDRLPLIEEVHISKLVGPNVTPQARFILASKIKLATTVESDSKPSLSIATTPRCKGGRYSFPWIAPLYP